MDRSEFLKTYQKYQLGELPTEAPNPKTKGLSSLVKSNLAKAIETLKQVDVDALKKMKSSTSQIEEMREAVNQTHSEGGRVFLVGCGATGRLSLLNEFLWREKNNTDQVISLMAGGDIALVHSLEGFEDYPEFGERHLTQLGFTENDLLIATTEGGETPYVIGATEAAAQISKRNPFYLYCNPDEILKEKVDRSKRVLENEGIEKICLFVGPMALSGSTRMQASTALQLAVGFALVETDASVESLIDETVEVIESCDFSPLAKLIQKEADIYSQGEFVMYMPRVMAITVFTDTTERSPTFSLPSFEGSHDKNANPSLCYILIPSAETKEEAWLSLLNHKPRALNWPEIDSQTTTEYLNDFDFSRNSLEDRESRLNNARQYLFEIDFKKDYLQLSLGGVETQFLVKSSRSLIQHTCLKLLLNTHSTLMMGLMGRYESNIMTWVTPTNGKLVDRASRYVDILLKEKGIEKDYLEIVNAVFDFKSKESQEGCVVLKVCEHLENS